MNITYVANPDCNCPYCPRLVEFREHYRLKEPSWHNAPVDSWIPKQGASSVKLLVVGMAPGLRGANRTGKPFMGDYAGELLYKTLIKFGYAYGDYENMVDDLVLDKTAITNAVRCVPPQNKPIGSEINNCRPFLEHTIAQFDQLEALLTLGKIAHDTTVRTLGGRVSSVPFIHNRQQRVGDYTIFSSYHCSRYNTNTRRLTTTMFEDVFIAIQKWICQFGTV